MNIFALDDCPIRSAQVMHDRHVVKMILESMQMISTALDAANAYVAQGADTRYGNPKYPESLRTLDGLIAKWDAGFGPHGWNDFRIEFGFPKPTHINHPCNIWLRDSLDNFAWLAYHAVALCSEYTYRFRKSHKYSNIAFIASRLAKLARADYTNHSPFAMAMPDIYRLMTAGKFDNPTHDSIWAYRLYYIGEKLYFGADGAKEYARWTRRPVPMFINEVASNYRFPNELITKARRIIDVRTPRVGEPSASNPFARHAAKLAGASLPDNSNR